MIYDLLIKNGAIVDGTRMPRFFGDLAIKDGLIAKMGADIPATRAKQVIDAKGLIVAPGVIDPHTHYDAQIHWDPYCTNSGWHGNTSFVVGNCGFGFMPCKAADREQYMLMMENTEQVPLGAMRQALGWSWETFPEWIEHMRALPKGVNLAAYLPLNSLMIYVMGYEAAKTRGATPAERERMKALLHEAMDAGAIGFGFSYLNEFNSHKDIDGSPMPTDLMHVEDAYALAEVLRERDEGVIQVLCELPIVVSNRHVVEKLAEISRRPVLHNVVSAFDKLPSYHRGILEWLDTVEAKGLNIFTQALAFRAWNEFNALDQNSWQHIDPFGEFTNAGTPAQKVALAADANYRDRARTQYDPARMDGAGGAVETWILLRAEGAKTWSKYEGQLLSEIADSEGAAAIDCFFDIVAQSQGLADFRTTEATSTDVDLVMEMMRHPRVLPGTSDGGAHVKFFSGGHFATDNLAWLVRETGKMSLEELHYKLSFLPARVLGLKNRGALMEGYAADLYIYDYATIGYDGRAYEVVHDLPDGDWRRVVRAQGVKYCVVNGEVTLKDSKPTGALSGRMLSTPAHEGRAHQATKVAAE